MTAEAPCPDCFYGDVCECSPELCGPSNDYAYFKQKELSWIEEVVRYESDKEKG